MTAGPAREITGSFSVNPTEIEWQLSASPFRYPFNSEADSFRGFAKFAAIPSLFAFMVHQQRFPSAAEGVGYLMQHCDPRYQTDPGVKRRAEKLYMDFARDMHTMGLLQRCDLFGWVSYQKALDICFNVDYIASLLTRYRRERESDRVGIQSAMRKDWTGDDLYEIVKQRRRTSRGDQVWEGRLYWLTNKRRAPRARPGGCWLFGPEHINDLAEEIRIDLGAQPRPETVAVQARLL